MSFSVLKNSSFGFLFCFFPTAWYNCCFVFQVLGLDSVHLLDHLLGPLIRARSVCWVFILPFYFNFTFSFYFSVPPPSILCCSLEDCPDHILSRSNDSSSAPSLSRSFLCLTAVKVTKSLMCVALLFSSPRLVSKPFLFIMPNRSEEVLFSEILRPGRNGCLCVLRKGIQQ